MLLSLITPTHKSDHLEETYRSLKLQSYDNWEWVLVPNGKAQIPDTVTRDKRVRVVEGGRDLHNVGALKKFACNAAKGDAFVEMDHDDLLRPGTALSNIATKLIKGAGFVYSDTAVFRFSDRNKHPSRFQKFTYSGQHGWESYPISVYGRELLATKCFDVTPRSLCEIYYAPDHVRCWSRKAYYAAGGHNASLSVCDDHELMIKTYLTGLPFEHTGGCEYLYRMFTHNTVLMRNKLIQTTTRELRERYTKELIRSWVQRNNYSTLNVTEMLREGWDVDRDLLQGFGEDEHGYIVADSVLQQWKPWQVREFMNEAYRSLVPGGYLTITVPEVHSGMGYGDVEWQSHFSAVSMNPYVRKNFAKSNGNIRCRFQQINCLEVYPSDWHRDNGFKYLQFDLVALKGQRHPGLQHI
jgi:glycosyltransferase involved in cell wall biosynthesis